MSVIASSNPRLQEAVLAEVELGMEHLAVWLRGTAETGRP
jgi:hypothetical protein